MKNFLKERFQSEQDAATKNDLREEFIKLNGSKYSDKLEMIKENTNCEKTKEACEKINKSKQETTKFEYAMGVLQVLGVAFSQFSAWSMWSAAKKECELCRKNQIELKKTFPLLFKKLMVLYNPKFNNFEDPQKHRDEVDKAQSDLQAVCAEVTGAFEL